MTNLELERDVKKLQKQYDEMVQVIQRASQKSVVFDQVVTQMREEIERGKADISNLKRQIQQAQTTTQSQVIKY